MKRQELPEILRVKACGLGTTASLVSRFATDNKNRARRFTPGGNVLIRIDFAHFSRGIGHANQFPIRDSTYGHGGAGWFERFGRGCGAGILRRTTASSLLSRLHHTQLPARAGKKADQKDRV